MTVKLLLYSQHNIWANGEEDENKTQCYLSPTRFLPGCYESLPVGHEFKVVPCKRKYSLVLSGENTLLALYILTKLTTMVKWRG